MKVTEIPFDPALILGPADKSGQPRGEGVHFSTIMRDLEESLKPRVAMEKGKLSTYAAGGFLWEYVIESAMARSLESKDCFRPGEIERDGVKMSPDLYDPGRLEVVELKCTWRSSNKWPAFEKHFWSWLCQMKAYAHALEVNRARLVVFFVNGNYKDSGPQVKQARFEFTDGELQENWRMLVAHAKRRKWL